MCRGDPELLKVVLEYRDLQKRSQRGDLVPNLLKRLKDVRKWKSPDQNAIMKNLFIIKLLLNMSNDNSSIL